MAASRQAKIVAERSWVAHLPNFPPLTLALNHAPTHRHRVEYPKRSGAAVASHSFRRIHFSAFPSIFRNTFRPLASVPFVFLKIPAGIDKRIFLVCPRHGIVFCLINLAHPRSTTALHFKPSPRLHLQIVCSCILTTGL